jgi:hypothetical protein
MVLAVAGARTSEAQKPGAEGGPVLGVSFDLALSVRGPAEPDEVALKLTGRFNVTGEFEMRLDSGGLGFDAEAVSTGGRIYVRAADEPWLYIDLDQIRAFAGMLGSDRGMDPTTSPECMQALMGFAIGFQQPADVLRAIGDVAPPQVDAIDGIPVIHHAGTVDLARVATILAPLLDNPACMDGEMLSLTELTNELAVGELPSIRYDAYLGEADGFPYRVRLRLDLEDGMVEFLANARPSQAFFDIRAPQGAVPLPLGPLPPR